MYAKTFSAILAGLMVLAVSGVVFGQYVNQEVEDADLATWVEDYDSGTETLDAVTDVAGMGVRYQVSSTASSGWIKIGISDDYPVAHIYGFPWNPVHTGFADWSGYTRYQLHFKNNHATDDVYVKAYYTTTSSGYWHEGGGFWLSPGDTGSAVIDLTGDSYIDQVCNFGFELGANYGIEATEFDVIVTARIDNIAVDPASVACLSTDEPCDEVEVLFSREDTTPVRGYSVTFELSSELELCDVMSASIAQGPYLSGVGTTYFYTTNNGGGSYTVDCSILGLPCGATGDGVLFTLDVQGSGGDGTGTITVTSVTVRDCSNAPVIAIPGEPVDVRIDHTAPTAIADVAASQVKSGNGTDGTTDIALTFTTPGDAAEVEVYRAPYGDYPEYDDGTGAEPGAPGSYPPGSPWVLTSVTATGQTDEPASRDFWYYVVYTKDACGNVSAVSNKTTGTLNYHLGDVAPSGGDNDVGTDDMSLLGSNYWKTLIHNDPVNYLDVGPTTDYSVDGLPTTDNEVQFEDLMMFAINFDQVSLLASPGPRVMEHPGLALEMESGLTDVVRARLVLTGNRESVKGLHAAISYGEGLEFVGLSRGGLWKDQSGPVFLEHRAVGGQLEVDGAVMGTSSTLQGSGVVCEVSFRVVGTVEAMPHLVVADLRDLANRRLERKAEPRQIGVESEPLLSQELRQVEFSARPNPFSGSTELRFAVPSGGRVSVKIYDAGGRLVRTLMDEEVGAGRYRAVWESQGVSPGVYMAILETGREREVRKVTLLP